MLLFCLILVLVNKVSADLDLGSIREKITQHVINRSPYDSIPKIGDKPVPVSIGYFLINIQDADVLKNVIELVFVLKITWKDYNLKWNDPSSPAYHIKEITVPTKEIWTPNINLLFPVGQPGTYASELVNVYKDGRVFWAPQITTRANCDLSKLTTKNKATCSVKVAPWRFPSQEVDVSCPKEDDLILSEYVECSKFKVLNVTQRSNRVKYDCCPDYFDNAELLITFERKQNVKI